MMMRARARTGARARMMMMMMMMMTMMIIRRFSPGAVEHSRALLLAGRASPAHLFCGGLVPQEVPSGVQAAR
eukprot:11330164-Karenia_brevis.AAC.1